jgi:hypothetical protein
MDQSEIRVIAIAGLVGFGTIWYFTGSQTAGWAFIAGAGVIGECTNALAQRLDRLHEELKLSNSLRNRQEEV